MNKVTTFASAFKECGIGGHFSKFQLVQVNEWFGLVFEDTLAGSLHCFRVHESFDAKPYDQISGREAQLLIENSPEWLSYFKTAQKVISRVVTVQELTRKVDRVENLYYLDRIHKSVFIVNGRFVIEVGPAFRTAPEIPSHTVYDYLEVVGKRDFTNRDRVKVFTRYGDVVVSYRGEMLYTNRTAKQFNADFEVA